MAHGGVTVTTPADSGICLRICVIYDSREGADVTIAPQKTRVVLKFTGSIFQSRKCKSDASEETRWMKALEHKGGDSCLIIKITA